jgi:hypothetical protein
LFLTQGLDLLSQGLDSLPNGNESERITIGQFRQTFGNTIPAKSYIEYGHDWLNLVQSATPPRGEYTVYNFKVRTTTGFNETWKCSDQIERQNVNHFEATS